MNGAMKTRAVNLITGKSLKDQLQRDLAIFPACSLLLLAGAIYQIVDQPGSPWTYVCCACWGVLIYLYLSRAWDSWQILRNPLFYLIAIKHDLGTPPERNQS